MSKLTRTLIIGATLTAMHLAGMTAVAQAQANDEPVRQPPTERQVGESWHHRQAASPEQTAADAALQRVQARERFAIPNDTRPDTCPSAHQAKQTARLAHCVAGGAGCCAGGRAGHPGCQADQAPGSAGTRRLTMVPPLDGAAAPTRQPHRPP
jgi:hypothetical protein